MEKIEETIKEIAIKHGVAVGRDDPIMILHTINERLMKETAAAQRQILHEFKEELESAAHKWEIAAKKTAERILDVALTASKEAIAEGGKKVADAIGREVDSRLAQANATIKHMRVLVMISALLAAVMTLLAAVAVLWATK
ncbi:MAG: conjugal transfer protein TraM [Pseudomonadota bacterium]